MSQPRKRTQKTKPEAIRSGSRAIADDFVTVARRLGADEDKARFEAKLGKIAKAHAVPAKPKA